MPARDAPVDPPRAEAPPVPSWIAQQHGDAPDDAAFLAGAALAHLHPVASGRLEAVPLILLRDRLALAAAEAAIVRAGGRARADDLRDRLAFLSPDARMDPETARLAFWRRAVSCDLRGEAPVRLLLGADEVVVSDVGASWRAAGQGGASPVARAADLLAHVRTAMPRHPDAATMLADAALARALGWPRLLPLLTAGLTRRDLLLDGGELREACCRAVAREAVRAARMAADLERRAERLRAVAPRLRAKASEAAVALFLARDAVAPTMDLAPVVRGTRARMSPRAAARLCDRLVSFGVVRELTGRTTFRLYGL